MANYSVFTVWFKLSIALRAKHIALSARLRGLRSEGSAEQPPVVRSRRAPLKPKPDGVAAVNSDGALRVHPGTLEVFRTQFWQECLGCFRAVRIMARRRNRSSPFQLQLNRSFLNTV